jgi:hypothetical protein
LPSDYVRQTRRADNKQKSRASHEAKEKLKQIKADEELAMLLAAEADDLDLPLARVAYKYKLGADPLEDPNEIRNLPTQMRWLHDWYKRQAANQTSSFGLFLPEYVYHGACGSEMYCEFECLFQLFQKQNLDVQILSLWTV